MYLVSARIGHPKLEKWKYPLPGDEHVLMIEPLVLDVATDKVVRLQLPPQQRLSSLCDELSCENNGHWDDAQWAPDGKTLALVSTSRDRKHEWFRVADASTGAVRTVFEESVRTYFNSGNSGVGALSGVDPVAWRYLPASHEAIWYSDRSNWGNLYLYSLKTGKLERAITTGKGNVTQVLHVDRRTGTIWFRAVGRTPGLNPYYEQLWKVSLRGGKPTLLTPEPCDHTGQPVPAGKILRRRLLDADAAAGHDAAQRPQRPHPRHRRSRRSHPPEGDRLATARADRRQGAGRQDESLRPAVQADGLRSPQEVPHHRLHLPRPADRLDCHLPTSSPRITTTSRWPSSASSWWRSMAWARRTARPPSSSSGTATWATTRCPTRSPRSGSSPRRYPWIDLTRVGIWGHSGGGNATADAMFRYPDFFKVGWAESGNHDNRNYENPIERDVPGPAGAQCERQEQLRQPGQRAGGLASAGAPDAHLRHHGRQRAAGEHPARGPGADQGEQATST